MDNKVLIVEYIPQEILNYIFKDKQFIEALRIEYESVTKIDAEKMTQLNILETLDNLTITNVIVHQSHDKRLKKEKT